MRNTIAIARKELGIYFSTVIGYISFATVAFIVGLVFISTLNQFQRHTQDYLSLQQPQMLERLNFNDAIIRPVLSMLTLLFLLLVPLLTMRLIAEEKQNRTFELLMTSPVTSLEIVLGKFAAVAIMIAMMTAIPLTFPLILSMYGTGTASASGVEWSPIWSSELSLFLLGITFASLGLFISSLTESQIVAALLTFAVLLVGFALPMIASRLEGDWRAIVEYVSPIPHANRGIEGRVALHDLVYFGSVISACVVFTLRAVESQRWRG
jgi:ABC-2 type transport system permease protein